MGRVWKGEGVVKVVESDDGTCECLVEIPEDVVERFESDGEADHFGEHTCGALLVLVQLPMRRRCGVDNERLRVTDVGQVREELDGFDAPFAGLRTAFDAEREDAT